MSSMLSLDTLNLHLKKKWQKWDQEAVLNQITVSSVVFDVFSVAAAYTALFIFNLYCCLACCLLGHEEIMGGLRPVIQVLDWP